MADHTSNPRILTALRIWCSLGLAYLIARALPVAAAWLAGRAEAYPGQYARQFWFNVTMVSLFASTLVGIDPRAASRRGRILHASLVAVAVLSVAFQIWRDQGR